MIPHFDHPRFADVPRRTVFYFVRHGESEANRKGMIQGRLDPTLSEKGREHARAAGRWFASIPGVDLVLTSPLRRAAETAELIAQTAELPAPEPLRDLIELDTGIFSGIVFSEIQAAHPTEWRKFQRYSWESVPKAERIHSLKRRALAVWNRLITETQSSRRAIVCVTHAGMLQWLIRASFGTQNHAWMPVFRASNCGIFSLAVAPAPAVDELPASFFAEWELLNHLPYEA